jgi:hypothetical protein
MMFKPGRLLPAMLLAPLAAPLLFFVGALLFTPVEISSPRDIVPFLGVSFGLAAPVSYVAVLVVGLPATLLLHRLGWLKLPVFLAAGAFLGAAVQSLFFLLFFSGSGLEVSAWHVRNWLLLGAALGVGVAASFWFVGGITSGSSRVPRSARPAAEPRR